jgi:hypothetical protein
VSVLALEQGVDVEHHGRVDVLGQQNPVAIEPEPALPMAGDRELATVMSQVMVPARQNQVDARVVGNPYEAAPPVASNSQCSSWATA